MTNKKEVIIDGVDVSECDYAILPKKQCPAKSMPYAKETSCIACKEHNTKHNFCKNNPNCNFKRLKRKERECENLNVVTTTQRKTNIELTVRLGEMVLKNGNLYQLQKQYRQILDEIKEFCKQELKDDEQAYVNVNCILDIINKAEGSGENGNT